MADGPTGKGLEANADLCYAPATAETHYLPPTSGWTFCVEGIYPPPTITVL